MAETFFHLAVIPDGNRRWAKKSGIKASQLYNRGTDKAVEITETAFKNGVSHLSLWGSSYANINQRSSDFFKTIDRLYRDNIQRFVDHKMMEQYDVRIEIIGEWRTSLTPETIAVMDDAIAQTKHRRSRVLSLLISYSGSRERGQAVQKLLENPEKVDSIESATQLLQKNSWTSYLPPVDLIVRTGAWEDPHNSAGFMSLLADEAQYAYPEALWPDFDSSELETIIDDFKKRERRRGK